MGWNSICPSETDILVQFPLQGTFFAIFEAILETIQSSVSIMICFKTSFQIILQPFQCFSVYY